MAGFAPGEEWGEPTTARPDFVVEGDDRALAAALVRGGVGRGVVPLVELLPSGPGGIASTLGLPFAGSAGARPVGPDQRRALPLDALEVWLRKPAGKGSREPVLGVSGVEIGQRLAERSPWRRGRQLTVSVDGAAPRAIRASSVLVMTGELLGRDDVNPRSHPGDGAAELYLVDVPRAERRAMRARLRSGTHVPHPRIARRTGARFVVECPRGAPVWVDGALEGTATSVEVVLRPGVYRILV